VRGAGHPQGTFGHGTPARPRPRARSLKTRFAPGSAPAANLDSRRQDAIRDAAQSARRNANHTRQAATTRNASIKRFAHARLGKILGRRAPAKRRGAHRPPTSESGSPIYCKGTGRGPFLKRSLCASVHPARSHVYSGAGGDGTKHAHDARADRRRTSSAGENGKET